MQSFEDFLLLARGHFHALVEFKLGRVLDFGLADFGCGPMGCKMRLLFAWIQGIRTNGLTPQDRR